MTSHRLRTTAQYLPSSRDDPSGFSSDTAAPYDPITDETAIPQTVAAYTNHVLERDSANEDTGVDSC
jgi:hypothetical protein